MKLPHRALVFLALAMTGAALAGPASADDQIVVGASGGISIRSTRHRGYAPATLHVGFTATEANSDRTPELDRIALQISPKIKFDTQGLPSCRLEELYRDPAGARQRCAGSLVGVGSVTSEIALHHHDAVVVKGRLLAFFSSSEGVPRILAQVRTSGRLALTYVLPFQLRKSHGAFGTSLSVDRMTGIIGSCAEGSPDCFRDPYAFRGIYGRISRFAMSLRGHVGVGAGRHTFVTAHCPGRGAGLEPVFPILRANLEYFNEPRPHSATASGGCQGTVKSGRRLG